MHNNSHVGSWHKIQAGAYKITVVLEDKSFLHTGYTKINKNKNYAVFTRKIASLIGPREKE